MQMKLPHSFCHMRGGETGDPFLLQSKDISYVRSIQPSHVCLLVPFTSLFTQTTLSLLCFLLLCATAVLSIVGNLLVIVTAVRRSSKMRPPELLCVNLAVTDLGAAVTMYPLAVASAWSHRWLGGDITCIYYGLVGFFFGVASIMNLVVLAVVRFIVSLNLQSPSE